MPLFQIQPPFAGLNTRDDASLIRENEATVALNVSLERGTLKTREGYTQRHDLSDPVRGIYGFMDEEKKRRIVYITDQLCKVEDVSDGSLATITELMAIAAPTTPPQFVEYKGRVYIAFQTGIGGRLYSLSKDITGALKLRTNTLPKPVISSVTYVTDDSAAVPFVAHAGGATFDESVDGKSTTTTSAAAKRALKGKYSYKISFYSQSLDIEGVASERAIDTVTGESSGGAGDGPGFSEPDKEMALLIVNAASLTAARNDNRISHIKVFRKKESRGQTEWHFIKRVRLSNSSTTTQRIYDDTIDSAISLTDVAPFSVENDNNFEDATPEEDFDETADGDPSAPAEGQVAIRTIEMHGNVMFGGGVDNRLWFSKPDKPGIMNENINIGGGAPITGLSSFNGVLYVFTERDIYVVDGSSKSDFRIKRKVKGIGCHVVGSIIPTENGIFFWGDDAVYAFDGEQASDISEPIKDKIEGRHRAKDSHIAAGWDKEKGCVFWTLWSAADAATSIVFEYKNSRVAQKPSWVQWQFGPATARMSCSDQVVNSSGGYDVLYGFENDNVGTRGTNMDSTGSSPQAINLKWTTGELNGGAPGQQKKWGTVELAIGAGGSGTGLQLMATADGNANTITGISIENPVVYNRIRRTGREVQLEFTHASTASSGVEILGLNVSIKISGRKS